MPRARPGYGCHRRAPFSPVPCHTGLVSLSERGGEGGGGWQMKCGAESATTPGQRGVRMQLHGPVGGQTRTKAVGAGQALIGGLCTDLHCTCPGSG